MCNISHLQAENPPWKFDVLDVTFEVQNTDIFEMEAKITQPTRGVYAVSGVLNFKEDITDECHMELQLLYSKTGTGNSYSPTPFRLQKMNTTEFMNWPYKDYLLDTLRTCAENFVELEEDIPFVAPVKKTRVVLNECKFNSDKLPTVMKNGFYKMEIRVYDQIEAVKPEFLIPLELFIHWSLPTTFLHMKYIGNVDLIKLDDRIFSPAVQNSIKN
uniref:Uncharacterized protein n=1 Tax=Glossina brevipalpis TaxID=37001 RepID=A0A1A9X5P0_9MUSC